VSGRELGVRGGFVGLDRGGILARLGLLAGPYLVASLLRLGDELVRSRFGLSCLLLSLLLGRFGELGRLALLLLHLALHALLEILRISLRLVGLLALLRHASAFRSGRSRCAVHSARGVRR
jgi:hypothetical protein